MMRWLIAVGVSFVVGWFGNEWLRDAEQVVVSPRGASPAAVASVAPSELAAMEQRIVNKLMQHVDDAVAVPLVSLESQIAMLAGAQMPATTVVATEREQVGHQGVHQEASGGVLPQAQQQLLFETVLEKLKDPNYSQGITFENINELEGMKQLSQASQDLIMAQVAEMLTRGELDPGTFFGAATGIQ